MIQMMMLNWGMVAISTGELKVRGKVA